MRKIFLLLFILPAAICHSQVFSITLPDSLGKKPLDGRLFLLLSNNDKAEPRFQVNGGPNTQLMFGVNVDDWKPGTAKTVSATAFG